MRDYALTLADEEGPSKNVCSQSDLWQRIRQGRRQTLDRFDEKVLRGGLLGAVVTVLGTLRRDLRFERCLMMLLKPAIQRGAR